MKHPPHICKAFQLKWKDNLRSLNSEIWVIDQTRLNGFVIIRQENDVLLFLFVGINDRHDDVIKWNHFPSYWPFVRGIQRSLANSPHKGQWRRALKFSLICAWINGWVNNREAGDLRRHRTHYDVTVMDLPTCLFFVWEPTPMATVHPQFQCDLNTT